MNQKPQSGSDGCRRIVDAKRHIQAHKERYYQAQGDDGKESVLLGSVERFVGVNVTSFNFYTEAGEFVLASSCINDMTGEFVFHTLQDSHLRRFHELPHGEISATYLGRMKANFLGTTFTLYGNQQNELALLQYDTNLFGKVPNRLRCAIPACRSRLRAASDLPRYGTSFAKSKSLAELLRQSETLKHTSVIETFWSFSCKLTVQKHVDPSTEPTGTRMPYRCCGSDDTSSNDLRVLESKKPAWNSQAFAWTLAFDGRVKKASKKNLLMVEKDTEELGDQGQEDKVYLRFGKISKNCFALDHSSSISPITALAIACTRFARKLAVT